MNLKISVNLKIIFLVLSILVVTVGYLIHSSIKIQEQDKINLAYQTQLNETKFLSQNFQSYINNSLNTLRQVASLDLYQQDKKELIENLLKNQTEISRIYLTEVPIDSSELSLYYKSSNEFGDSEEKIVNHWIATRFNLLAKSNYVLSNLANDRGIPQVGVMIADFKYDPTGSKVLILTGVINTKQVFENISYLVEVVDQQGELIFTSDYKNLITKEYNKNLFIKANSNQQNTATLEITNNEIKYLGSFTKLSNNTIFLTSQPLIKVISPIYVTTQKMVIIGLIALCLAILASLKLAKSISKPIESLTLATKKIALGNFNISLKEKSNDEIGDLANSFEMMSTKIQGLLKEQVDKVRLENEMNIAATVQKTLFPENKITTKSIDIFSYSAPASECGGDLWGYFYEKNKLYFIIADATGHGLPSALITVAAKSTLSLIKRMLEKNMTVSPAEVLSYANRSVFETSQGKIMMTCFVGVIDFNEHTLTYSNAGHNPPWVFSGDKIHSLAIPGTRLGESIEQNDFKEKVINLTVGDKIFLYTDGITENANLKGEMFDKKRVRNLLKDNLSKKSSSMIDILVKEFNSFMNKKNLDDDTTIVLMEIKELNKPSEIKEVA